MRTITALSATLLFALAPSAFAAPSLSVIPQGLQAGNWVWEVDITPDVALAGGSTPLDAELGFRLTGDPLISVANLSPLAFDTNVAGNTIFGWETPYGSPSFPEGIEANCSACTVINLATSGGHAATVVPGTTNEVFSALGSVDISTSGAVPYLKIIAQGPGSGGPLSSTIQWLGAYSGKGRIAQIVSPPMNGVNFDIFAGSATQTVPEPTSVVLIAMGTGIAAVGLAVRKRRSKLNSRISP